MSGKVGKFLIGAAIIGAAFAIPGFGGIAGGLFKTIFMTVGTGLAYGAIQGGLHGRQGVILGGATDTQAALPVVYGTTKVGMRYLDKRTGGENNKYLYIVGALALGSQDGNGIAGIDEIYFDDRLAVSKDGVVQDNYRDKVVVMGRNLGRYDSLWDTALLALFPAAWPTTSTHKGVADLILRLEFDSETAFPSGEPTITAVVRGQKVKDPRNLAAAAAFSTNPICCLYDLLTSPVYGLGCAAGEVDAAGSFSAMANHCDDFIIKNDTTGATGKRFECNGWLDTNQPVKDNIKMILSSCRGILVYEGGKYRVIIKRSVSPVAFTLNESNIIGDWGFVVPGIGEAPNLMSAQYVDPGHGPRITSISSTGPAVIDTATAHGLLTGQKVHIYEDGLSQGLTPPMLGVYTVSSIFSSTQFAIKETLDPGSGYITNSCRVTSENLPYQAANRVWPRPGTSNGYLVADNNYLAQHDISLPMTTDPYTAEQIMLVLLKEARAGVSVTLTATEAALTLQVGDVVNLTHTTPGFVSQPFWVLGIFLVPETAQVRIALMQYDDTAYTLDPLSTVPSRPTSQLPDPFSIEPPTDLALTSGDEEASPDADGSHRIYIRAAWTAAAHAFVDHYDVEYKRSSESLWRPVADINRTDTEALIGPVSEGVSYDVQIRAVNTMGRASGWLSDSVTPHLIDKKRSGSFWIDDFTARTPGRRWVLIFGTGSFEDVYDPDSIVGGKVGRVIGYVHYELADSIPFDPTLLYIMRWRVRQLRDPSSGTKEFTIGLNGLVQQPGQPGVFQRMNVFGQDSTDNQHSVVAYRQTLESGREWKDFYGFVKGYAGGKVALTSDLISHSGLGSFSAANLVDGDTDPTKVGATVSSAAAGACLKIDFGSDPADWKCLTDARLHMSADDSTAAWDFKYSDDGSTYFKAN